MKQAFIFTSFIALIGCNTLSSYQSAYVVDHDRIVNVYRQRIPGSRLVMYKFAISSTGVWDGDNSGMAILDSSLNFEKERIENIDAYYIMGSLKRDTLRMAYLGSPGNDPTSEEDTLMIPTKRYVQEYNGTPIEISEYRYTYGSPVGWSPGGNDYTFKSMSETDDSLFFEGLTAKEKGYGVPMPSEKGFIKGNIELIDSNGRIDRIEIKELILKRGEIYQQGGRNVILKDRPIVDMIFYTFYPVKQINASKVSDIGIYKRLQ